MADAPTTVYAEVQIDHDSISLTLISESGGNGPVIEDTERFTFDELQHMSGEHLTLRLSDESSNALAQTVDEAVVGNLLQSENLSEKAEKISDEPTEEQILAYMGLLGGGVSDGRDSADSQESAESESESVPEVGQIVRDGRPPEWSQDNRLEVVNISDKSASEYVVEERVSHLPDETVFDADPHCDSDEPVVEARYLDEMGYATGKTYGFAISRLDY